MESVTLNDHIAWCGALGCRRIAIIFEGEGPVYGREGWHRVSGGQTHGANAVMVVGDIRVMCHQKLKKGLHIFYPPIKAMAAPTNPLGTQSEVDFLSGVRAPRRVRKVSLFHIFLNLELLFCEIYDCKE